MKIWINQTKTWIMKMINEEIVDHSSILMMCQMHIVLKILVMIMNKKFFILILMNKFFANCYLSITIAYRVLLIVFVIVASTKEVF